jgi:[ribosomal protein S18]-alanine N-acetyltransferase
VLIKRDSMPKVRAMTKADLKDVFAIEIAAHPFPWTEKILSDCIDVGYCCQLIQRGEVILGFSIMSFVLDEAHILNICTNPPEQRRGYARLLLRRMLWFAAQRGAKTVFLEVRVSNAGAIRLYEQEGFNRVDTRKDYYPAVNGREDAIVFAITLSDKFR